MGLVPTAPSPPVDDYESQYLQARNDAIHAEERAKKMEAELLQLKMMMQQMMLKKHEDTAQAIRGTV